MHITENQIIGQIVAQDYRTAAVFAAHGIDFCCKGKRTIGEACESKNIAPATLIKGLDEALRDPVAGTIDYHAWPPDLLADYIEKKHHRYVAENIPIIRQYLEKVCRKHGEAHPELCEIYALFEAAAGELTQHMKKEELLLFPFVRKMEQARLEQRQIAAPHFGTVENPIQTMMHEHDVEGERFRKIAALSKGYTPPENACNSYRVAFALLKAFEEDLHLHIHLENNILFPRAVEMERELSLTQSLP